MDDQATDTTINKAPTQIRFAGFGIRFGAALIDFLILLPLAIANFYNLLNMKALWIAVVILAITTVYKPVLEYLYQATLGKMAVGIKVVDTDFERIDVTQAILRYFPWLITNAVSVVATILMFDDAAFYEVDSFIQYGEFANSQALTVYTQWIWLIILLSAAAIFFNSKKQAVHDMVAGTYCIYKS